MRDCKLWLRLPHDNRNRHGSVSSQVLQEIIKKEMRNAPCLHTLKFRFDLLSRNLKDMFSIEEVSYVVYKRLYAVLLHEYERAFDKLNEREEKNRKETKK